MKNLLPLPTPPEHIHHFIAIRNRKKLVVRNVLVASHVAIESRFDAFAARVAAGNIEAIGASTLIAISDQLRLCYDSPTIRLGELLATIKTIQPAGQLKYCPYCQTTLGKTEDHYLPASRFPEFSVHPLNLIPACSTCNSTKGDDWLDHAGCRQYLQLFIDAIPTVDFLRVELITAPGVRSVGARFELLQAGMPDENWQLIESHFRKLNLIFRYEELGSDEIAAMLSACRSHREAGGPDVRRYLRLEADKAANLFGVNHWRAKILSALSVHPDTIRLTAP